MIHKKIKKIFRNLFNKKNQKSELFNSDFRFKSIQQLIGGKLNKPELYLEALTHRSAIALSPLKKKVSNERLEYLGDSILNLIVTEYLFKKFRNKSEGDLTKLRSRFVNRDVLLKVANTIKLNKLVFISENAQHALESGAKSILSDTMEAFIGAIYLDKGLEETRKFIYKNIIKPNIRLVNIEDQNYKSRLLEYLQLHKLDIPKYQVVKEEGPQHSKIFTVEVLVNGKSMGTGKGSTKKEAEQLAAKEALSKLSK